MRRNRLERSAAAFLALVFQAGIVAFVRLARDHEGRHPDAGEVLNQPIRWVEVWLPPLEKRLQESLPRPPRTAPPLTQSLPVPDIGAAIASAQELVPRVDWTKAMEEAAQRVVQQDVDRENHGQLLDSKPRVLELPKRQSANPNVPGTVTQLPNGDVRVQLDHRVHCIYSRPSLAEHFDVWAQGRPPKCTRNRKVPDPVNLDAVKPDYLRRPLPEPPPNITPLPVLD
ncbi:MAG: hypothetical protein ABI859_09685 [Pseudomonadota bacterium]